MKKILSVLQTVKQRISTLYRAIKQRISPLYQAAKKWIKEKSKGYPVFKIAFSVVGIILSIIFLILDDPVFLIFDWWLVGAIVFHCLLLFAYGCKPREKKEEE